METQLASTPTLRALGRLTPDLAESWAWLTSPARIAHMVQHYEAAHRGGDPNAAALLSDWRSIAAAQRRLVAGEEGDGDGPDNPA